MTGWKPRRASESPDPAAAGAAAPGGETLARVRRLEIRTRWLVDSLLSGEFASVFSGRGMELSHVRAYQPGDDVRQIDWKVTARRGTPYVRRFVEERDLTVMLVVDVSASGGLGPGHRSTGEVAAEIAAALAFVALRNNDRVGLVLVSDRVERFVAPAGGRKHVVRLLADLLDHRARGTSTDLSRALEHVDKTVASRGIVFLLSDFIQDHRDLVYRAALGRVARKHDLVGVRLGNQATDDLPAVGWVELLDPESGRRITIDTGNPRVRDRYRRSIARAASELSSLLGEIGAEIVEVDTSGDPLQPLAEFFRRRRAGTR
jgi:uncharacterized protein (DUF58 family)